MIVIRITFVKPVQSKLFTKAVRAKTSLRGDRRDGLSLTYGKVGDFDPDQKTWQGGLHINHETRKNMSLRRIIKVL